MEAKTSTIRLLLQVLDSRDGSVAWEGSQDWHNHSQGVMLDLYTKGFVTFVAALFTLALYWMLAPFWGALAWGICLAFLLAPVHACLKRKLKGHASISAGIITALVPAVLTGPMVSLGVAFANQGTDLVMHMQQQPLRFDVSLLTQMKQYPIVGGLAEWLQQNITATTGQIEGWLVGGAQLLLQSLAATGGSFVLSALSTFIHFFIMLFLLFFLLRDGSQMLARAVRFVPLQPQRRAELLKLIGDTIRAVVYGEIMTAIVQGALVGIGFAFAGLPSAVVFAVPTAILALLPVGGAALVWAPAVVYLFATSQ